MNEQKESKTSKITVLCLGIMGIFLGITFQDKNIAYMVGLAFSIATTRIILAKLNNVRDNDRRGAAYDPSTDYLDSGFRP